MINPATVKLLLVAGFGLACAFGGWTANGWRLGVEVAELKGEVRVAEAQVRVVADKLVRCSDGAKASIAAGKAAVADGERLLAEARARSAQQAGRLKRLEELMRAPTPQGAKCAEAWADIRKTEAEWPGL